MRRWKAALLKTAVLAALVAIGVSAALAARNGDAARTTTKAAALPPPVRASRATFVWNTPNAAPPVLRSGCPPRTLPQAPPPAFRGFPLPDGSTFVGTRRTGGPRPLVFAVGYAPLPLLAAARYFRTQLPRRGYVGTGGDQEAWEAEASFRGHGRTGAWKVRRLTGCKTSVALLVAITTRPSAS